MNEKKIKQLINIAYLVAAVTILASAFFKIQHYPYGNYLHNIGWGLGIFVGATDNIFLRRTIKKIENRRSKE